MTDQAQKDRLFQVWAVEKATGQLVVVPCFPRIAKEVAEEFVATMKAQILLGNEKRYADPQALEHLSF